MCNGSSCCIVSGIYPTDSSFIYRGSLKYTILSFSNLPRFSFFASSQIMPSFLNSLYIEYASSSVISLSGCRYSEIPTKFHQWKRNSGQGYYQNYGIAQEEYYFLTLPGQIEYIWITQVSSSVLQPSS